MLVDTDVMIWHLRGYPTAAQRLDQLERLTISAVTYMELLQGMRNRVEMAALQKGALFIV
jgi:predicted nucleic acid-binding protein